MASLYRAGEKVGVFENRYCKDPSMLKKNGCKEYAFKRLNTCEQGDWIALQSARYVLVPISEI